MKKIHICYLLNDLSTGGVSKVVYDIISQIDGARFKVSIVILEDNLEFLESNPLPGDTDLYICPYQFTHDYSLRKYFQLAFFKKIIGRRAKIAIEKVIQIKPDILHLHVLPRELMIGILVKKTLNGIALVYTDHSLRISEEDYTALKRNLLGWVYRSLYRNFNVIAVSEGVAFLQQRRKWLNPRLHHELIENRIDLDIFQGMEYSNDDHLKVVYVSRLTQRKGHMLLLEAWKSIKNKNLTLTLVGDGELREALEAFAAEEVKRRTVIFTGSVGNVKSYLKEADLAVFPSEKEGLSLALLEKMACGLPIIVNNIPELTDFISDKRNGLVFNTKEELIESIEFLGENAEARKKLGVNARSSLEERWGNEAYYEAMENFYERVLQ